MSTTFTGKKFKEDNVKETLIVSLNTTLAYVIVFGSIPPLDTELPSDSGFPHDYTNSMYHLLTRNWYGLITFPVVHY